MNLLILIDDSLKPYLNYNKIVQVKEKFIHKIDDMMYSPMDQFEIKPFLGKFLGLNFTPIGLITNISVYIGLVVLFIILFYIYGSFKELITING